MANQPYFVVPLVNGSVHVVQLDENEKGIQLFHRIVTHEGGAEVMFRPLFTIYALVVS